MNNPTPGADGDDETTRKVLEHLERDSLSRGQACRKIVFRIRSHDQGWGGGAAGIDTQYKGSFTWFEFGLERMMAVRDGKW